METVSDLIKAFREDERDTVAPYFWSDSQLVRFANGALTAFAEKTKSNISERIAVMAALNIAHEHLSKKQSAAEIPSHTGGETGLDIGSVKRRISDMEAQLAAVLEPQERLI